MVETNGKPMVKPMETLMVDAFHGETHAMAFHGGNQWTTHGG
jgi:hypothetical protein